MPSFSLNTKAFVALVCLLALAAETAQAAQRLATEAAFPDSTVGYLSIANAPDFRERWERTQLGLLCADPAMQPFIEQLKQQLERKAGGVKERLGVTLSDFQGVASGQVALGAVALGEEKESVAVAMLVDVTGNQAEAQELLDKIDARLTEIGSTKNERAGGLIEYDIPADEEAGRDAAKAVYFNNDNWIGAANDPAVAAALMARVAEEPQPGSLAALEAYRATQEKATKAAGKLPATVRWFVSPFELDLAVAKRNGEGLVEKEDTLELLRGQGFDAIKGIGGVVTIAADKKRDFVHHTAVYAPGKPGAASKLAKDKYDLAMRMLQLPNASPEISGNQPPVEPWAPRQVASYTTVHVDVQNAFDHFGSLFDAFAGYEDAFETTLRAFEKDHYGPKINLRNEVVEHIGSRVVITTDYTLPITTESERYLIVLDVRNEAALREPLDKWLENDGAERKEIDGVPYWEIVPESEALDEDLLGDDLLDDDLLSLDDEPDWRAEREERVIRRAAVCLHQDKLAIGSDVEFLKQALFGVEPGDSLAQSADLRVTLNSLSKLAPGKRCAWTFTRTDEALRPSYELVREGKMPEAQTFFGRLLNRILTTDEEREVDAIRSQKIDGSLLPSFELARRYFGPAARSARSDDDGWLLSGVILSKAAE